MRILQLGAGSMGTRRLRDLSQRSDVELALYDERRDRGETAHMRWSIPVFDDFDKAIAWSPEALSISTPPHRHAQYVQMALENGWHHFSEANVWTNDYTRTLAISKDRGLVSAASSSLIFLPVVKELRRMVSDELGDLHSYQMALSVYMPGWHPGEGSDFYARQRSTSAAREMVPFELGMLNLVFGAPVSVSGTVRRRGKLNVDSEDAWCLQMTLDNGATGQLCVLMASPAICRKGQCIGDNGMVEFDISSGDIRRDLPVLGISDARNFGAVNDVLEAAYAEEINTFVDAVMHKAEWPYDYAMSAVATCTLAAAEISALSGKCVDADPSVQPGITPTDYTHLILSDA